MSSSYRHQIKVHEIGFRNSLVMVWESAKKMIAGSDDGLVITIEHPKRSSEQNRKMWAMLHDIASQIAWHGIQLTEEEWKDLLTAGLKKVKVVPNIEGNGFVILGQRTSKMNKREFAELIEFIYYFGSENGVEWSDESLSFYDEMVKAGALKVT